MLPFLGTRAALSRAKHTTEKKGEAEVRKEKIQSNIHFLNTQEVLSALFLLRTHIYLSCSLRATWCQFLQEFQELGGSISCGREWVIKGIIKGIKRNVGDWQIICVILRTLGNGAPSARWSLLSRNHFWSGGSDTGKIKQHNSNLSPE